VVVVVVVVVVVGGRSWVDWKEVVEEEEGWR